MIREGSSVLLKETNEQCDVVHLIGDTAVVKCGDKKRKVKLKDIKPFKASVTRSDFINTHQMMINDDEYIQSFFSEEIDAETLDYHRTMFMAFGVELCSKLFEHEL